MYHSYRVYNAERSDFGSCVCSRRGCNVTTTKQARTPTWPALQTRLVQELISSIAQQGVFRDGLRGEGEPQAGSPGFQRVPEAETSGYQPSEELCPRTHLSIRLPASGRPELRLATGWPSTAAGLHAGLQGPAASRPRRGRAAPPARLQPPRTWGAGRDKSRAWAPAAAAAPRRRDRGRARAPHAATRGRRCPAAGGGAPWRARRGGAGAAPSPRRSGAAASSPRPGPAGSPRPGGRERQRALPAAVALPEVAVHGVSPPAPRPPINPSAGGQRGTWRLSRCGEAAGLCLAPPPGGSDPRPGGNRSRRHGSPGEYLGLAAGGKRPCGGLRERREEARCLCCHRPLLPRGDGRQGEAHSRSGRRAAGCRR